MSHGYSSCRDAAFAPPAATQVGIRVGSTLVIAAVIANGVAPSLVAGLAEAELDFGVSKVLLLCAVLGVMRLIWSDPLPDGTHLPFIFLPAALGCCVLSSEAAWLGLAISMVLILGISAFGPRSRDGALILLAVSLHVPIVAMAGTLFGGHLLGLDAALAAVLLGLSGAEVHAQQSSLYVPGGVALLVVWKCGVLSNLSVSLIFWYSVTRFCLGRIPARSLIYAAAIVGVVVASNAARLAAMTVSQQMYDILHSGEGASVLRLGTLLTVAALVFLNIRRGQDA